MNLRPAQVLTLPASVQAVEFISDLHLGGHTPQTVEVLASYLRQFQADALFILGDLFEVWVGDDARTQAFEASVVALLRRFSQQRLLYLMVGNRDFLLGPDFAAGCGAQLLEEPTLLQACGQSAVLVHGDALCIADTEYQSFRGQVRSAPWQQEFLARPLGERVAIATRIRHASEQRKAGVGPEGYADADSELMIELLACAGAQTLVHGHTHRPGSNPLGGGAWRHVLSDWDCDGAKPRAQALRLSALGWQRLDVPTVPC